METPSRPSQSGKVPCIRTCFASLADPRRRRKRIRHPLLNLVVIALCGTIAGADGWEDIAIFADERKEWLARFLDLSMGLPSHDTLGRVFAALDPIAFQKCLVTWIGGLHRTTKGQVIAIDGVTYVIDPGFGPFACPFPIPVDGSPVPTSAPTHRLSREGNDWILYVTQEGKQVPGWISTMEEEYPVDFEMMNYYISTHPASFFTHNILASAVTHEGRVNIMNQDVNIIGDGAGESVRLTDRKGLRALVAQHFGFDLPELETMRVDGVPEWQ